MDGKVWRTAAARRRTSWPTGGGPIAGIASNPDGTAVLSGWMKGKATGAMPVGVVSRPAENEHGSAGSTAVTLSSGSGRGIAVVVALANGGMSVAQPGGVQTGKVVRVNVSQP